MAYTEIMTGPVAYHAASMLDQGLSCDTELMNAKLVNVESSLDSARLAMEIHAAYGLSTERHVERYLRDAFHIYAPAGTSDVQRLRLAEAALGNSNPAPAQCPGRRHGRTRRAWLWHRTPAPHLEWRGCGPAAATWAPGAAAARPRPQAARAEPEHCPSRVVPPGACRGFA